MTLSLILGSLWLALFTGGLFWFANHVQKRDQKRRETQKELNEAFQSH